MNFSYFDLHGTLQRSHRQILTTINFTKYAQNNFRYKLYIHPQLNNLYNTFCKI